MYPVIQLDGKSRYEMGYLNGKIVNSGFSLAMFDYQLVSI